MFTGSLINTDQAPMGSMRLLSGMKVFSQLCRYENKNLKVDEVFIVTSGDKPEEQANIIKKLLIPLTAFLCLRVWFLRPHTIPLHLYVPKVFLRSILTYLTLDIRMVI